LKERIVSHAVLPGIAFVAVAALFSLTDLDRTIEWAWAFDAARGIFPGRGAWWSTNFLHTGGEYFVFALAAAVAGAFAASFVVPSARPWRRPAVFALVAMVLATLLVSILKALTNVDCPSDLIGFGGTLPYVPLFADRPDDLPYAKCFPGSHASSGFALIAFYFVLRERWPRAANVALAGGLAVGAVFGFAQEARGAHFLSHDLSSAFIVWFVELAVYTAAFGSRLWPLASRERSIEPDRADRAPISAHRTYGRACVE
jgi:membrane-associated PAP2 superfamily phosphatase